MKITRFNITNLRNEEWFNFYTEFKTLVTAATPLLLNIEVLFGKFSELYRQADQLLEAVRKSGYTNEIAELDGLRDNTFRGLSDAVKSAEHHYDEAHRAAAERLKLLLDHFGTLAAKSYNEETAGIYNLLQEFRGQYAPYIATLALQGWVDELERNNKDFEAAILARNNEKAGNKHEVNLREIRRQTDRCYLDIAERLDALMLINGNGNFADFVTKLNTNIERYKNSLSRRGTKKTEKKTV